MHCQRKEKEKRPRRAVVVDRQARNACHGLLGRVRHEADLAHACTLCGSHGLGHALVADFLVALDMQRSEEHTSELQSRLHLVCRLLLEKKYITLRRFCPKFLFRPSLYSNFTP